MTENALTEKKYFQRLSSAVEFCLLGLTVSLTFSIALSEIFFATGLVLWIIKKFIDKDLNFVKEPIYLFLALFVAFIGLSIANAEYFYVSFRGVIKAVKPILAFLMVIDTFKTEKQMMRYFKVLFILFLVVCLNGMWQYWTGKDFIRGKGTGFFNEDFRRRITAAFSYYSQFGSYLILSVSLFLGLALGSALRKKRERFLLLLMSFAGFVCLFHTGSRGSWLAMGASIFFLGILKKSKLILGGLIVAGVLAFFVLPDYMLIHFDADRKEQSVSERFMLWQRAADVIKAKPVLGVGINNYNLVHHKYDTVKDSRVKGYYAHNGYLQLAAEIGIIGLSFFVLFLLFFFFKVIRGARGIPDPLYKDASLGLISGCFGFLCLVTIDTVLHSFQSGLIFWIFMGISMACYKVGVQSKSKTEGIVT